MRRSLRFDRDRMNNAPAARVAEGALAVISAIQTRPPEVQPLAIGVAFLLLAERLRLSPQDVATVVGNMMEDRDGKRIAEFRAVQMYIENEVNR